MFVVVFFPVSLLLWAFNKLIERLTRHTPQRVQLTLARRELHRVLDEGHDVGILRPRSAHLRKESSPPPHAPWATSSLRSPTCPAPART